MVFVLYIADTAPHYGSECEGMFSV